MGGVSAIGFGFQRLVTWTEPKLQVECFSCGPVCNSIWVQRERGERLEEA